MRAYLGGPQKADDAQHIMHALADEGRVIAECVAGELARVFHKPLPPPFVRRVSRGGRPCSPQQQIGRHHSHPRLHETVEWRPQSAVGGHRGPGSGLVEPDDDPARPRAWVEPRHRHLLAMRRVPQHSRHADVVGSLILPVEQPFHFAGLFV
jgi:hypothetical protein